MARTRPPRRLIPARYVAAALLALSTSLHAAEPAKPVAYSGPVHSATGALPPKLSVMANCDNGHARIVGTVTGGVYRIDLPAGVSCTMFVGEQDWESQPVLVTDAATAVGLPVLAYPADVPEPELARELIEMGKQDQALRKEFARLSDPAFAKRAAAEDLARQERLAEIVAAKGWPTLSMVGFQAAWLVAQHCRPEHLERLKAWLELMRQADARHEILRINLAPRSIACWSTRTGSSCTAHNTGRARMERPSSSRSRTSNISTGAA